MLVDGFPESSGKSRRFAGSKFEEFIIVRLPKLEQRYLWEAFQRVLRMTDADCWDTALRQELLDLSYEDITPPRNHFIYKPHFWPSDDLLTDMPDLDLNRYLRKGLDTEEEGFLLRLNSVVYRLAEQLFDDLAGQSGPIALELAASRLRARQDLPELVYYNKFLGDIQPPAPIG